MEEPLFRREAVAHQGTRMLGEVILTQPLRHGVLTALIALACLFTLLFLVGNDYTRRETVRGFLVPTQGVVALYPEQSGMLSQLKVREGTLVSRGEPLFSLRLDQKSTTDDYLSSEILRQLQHQHAMLEEAAALEETSLTLALQRQDSLIIRLEEEIAALGNQVQAQQHLLSFDHSTLVRAETLMARKLIAKSDMEEVERQFLIRQQESDQLALALTTKQHELDEAFSYRDSLKIGSQRERLDLQHRKTELQRQIISMAVEHDNVVRSPIAGAITAIVASEGQRVDPALPVLSLIPEDARLEAQLYVPTRAIGFLAEGQQVNLRYDAFPHQRFGIHGGSITQISRTATPQQEIPRLLSLQEPTYRVKVALDRQSILAYGREIALRPGLLLSADINVDSRSLLEWLLEPLLSLKGRSGRTSGPHVGQPDITTELAHELGLDDGVPSP